MKVNFRLNRGVRMILVGVVLIGVIGFAERRGGEEVCNDVVIKISNQYSNFFIDQQDIIRLITDNGSELVKGASFNHLNLKEIEERVKADPFIKTAQIYKDLKGSLIVNTELRRPFARILGNTKPDTYVAMDGTILPVSEKYITRSILISGSYADELMSQSLTNTEEGRRVYEMLNYIYNDKFWKAQIAQIDIDKNMNMVLYPQVTKQMVEFGKPEDIEVKFKKLKIFYTEILPQRGWNRYERVNLKYKDQIIAE
ncbi:MAG: cell division protein FtsQ [Bacteroidota bacterium]